MSGPRKRALAAVAVVAGLGLAKYAHASYATVSVERVDGTLTLDSPAGRGTRLRARIPVPR